MEVTEVDPASKKVISCMCLFCKFVGRSTVAGNRKRRSTGNVQFFQAPFRAETIKKHMVTQHIDDWPNHNKLSPSENRFFLEIEDATCPNAP